jgi:hypothetical protein
MELSFYFLMYSVLSSSVLPQFRCMLIVPSGRSGVAIVRLAVAVSHRSRTDGRNIGKTSEGGKGGKGMGGTEGKKKLSK